MATNLTAEQRSRLFNKATRENLHMMPKQTATEALSNLVFTMPKSRLLGKVYVMVKADIKVTGTAGKVTDIPVLTPYKILKKITMSLNNGFDPVQLSGEHCARLNMLQMHPDMIIPSASGTNCTFDGYTASTSGTVNSYSFMMELPVTLNENVTTGLILLQNNETMVQLSFDIATDAEMLNKSGYTATIEKVEIQPCLQTFTIPAVPEAYPDLSVLCLKSARTETFPGSGENVVKLPVGTIYRKLILHLEKEDGTPFEDSEITSPISISFNQADTPYVITAEMLRAINKAHLGYELPKGTFVFDFASQGQLTNLGGSRDLIDTERLQEFWVKFATNEGGKVSVISENITRLK